MYSRLIKKYLEALRPDSPNGLCEAFNRNGDESGRPAGHRSTAILGIQNRPRDMSRPNTPVKSGSNAGLQTGTFHYPLYENAGQKSTDPTAFLQRLAQILGGTMSNVDKTLYFKNEVNGNSLTFRLANHRGNAKKFVKHGETSGNFGVVIKMSEKRFIPDKDTDYIEEVFFPDKLTDAKMAAIEQGVADWLSRGVYTGPKGDETNPRNPIHANPVNQSVPWQQPQQPPQQPGGAGMAESLATIYTRGNAMNIKTIVNEAVRGLMEDEDAPSSKRSWGTDGDPIMTWRDEDLDSVSAMRGWDLSRDEFREMIERAKRWVYEVHRAYSDEEWRDFIEGTNGLDDPIANSASWEVGQIPGTGSSNEDDNKFIINLVRRLANQIFYHGKLHVNGRAPCNYRRYSPLYGPVL